MLYINDALQKCRLETYNFTTTLLKQTMKPPPTMRLLGSLLQTGTGLLVVVDAGGETCLSVQPEASI